MLLALTDNVLLQLFGRAHAFMLHMPFGVFVALVVLEAWSAWRKRPLAPPTRALLLVLIIGSSAVAAGSGWFLSEEPDYSGETLETHRKLGIAVAICSLAIGLCAWRGWRRPYVVTLGSGFVVLLVTGHYGGSMTHGEGFLLEPWHASSQRDTGQGEGITTAVDVVPSALPILIQRCGRCHGAVRHKGGLSLHERAAVLTGGLDGPVVVPGDPEAGDLMRRLRVPLEHDDRMPPDDKPQLTADELQAIADWIAEGLPVDDGTAAATSCSTRTPSCRRIATRCCTSSGATG